MLRVVGEFWLGADVVEAQGGIPGKGTEADDGGAVQAREEEIPGAVAGEVAAGAVRAVGGGGEAQYDDARVWVTEAGDGAAPVGLVFVGGTFLAGDLLTPLDQAWAKAARDYFGLQGG